MQIAGLQKTTLIDYPGKVAATIFTRGCSFACPFCHNPELVLANHFNPLLDEEEVLDFLKKRIGKLEAVCITGGEPTLQNDLIDFIKKIKGLGYLVKLDTNGSNNEKLGTLIDQKLIDYIAMDVKGPLEKYDILTNSKVDTEEIRESIKLIINSGIDYEFRTTFVKPLHSEEDFEKIGKLIVNAKKYFIQNFKDGKRIDGEAKFLPFEKQELERAKLTLEKYIEEVFLRI